MIATLSKRCRTCREDLPLDSYTKNRQSSDGLDYLCRSCKKVANAARDPEKLRASAREYRSSNLDAVRRRNREWAKTSSYTKKYRQRYPNIDRVINANQQAKRLGAAGRLTLSDLEQALARHGDSCHYCGGLFEEIDHVVALAAGGLNTAANIVPSCRRCNRSKGATRSRPGP